MSCGSTAREMPEITEAFDRRGAQCTAGPSGGPAVSIGGRPLQEGWLGHAAAGPTRGRRRGGRSHEGPLPWEREPRREMHLSCMLQVHSIHCSHAPRRSGGHACTLRQCWSHARCPLSVVPVHAPPVGRGVIVCRAGVLMYATGGERSLYTSMVPGTPIPRAGTESRAPFLPMALYRGGSRRASRPHSALCTARPRACHFLPASARLAPMAGMSQ